MVSLITPFISEESHTFELDKFYAFYKMIINPEEPIDYSGEKVYEDWPDQLLLHIAKEYKEKIMEGYVGMVDFKTNLFACSLLMHDESQIPYNSYLPACSNFCRAKQLVSLFLICHQ